MVYIMISLHIIVIDKTIQQYVVDLNCNWSLILLTDYYNSNYLYKAECMFTLLQTFDYMLDFAAINI